MLKVYVAGKYSDNNVISILNNIQKGIRASVEVLLAGYAPFCPWLDYQFQFLLRNDEQLTVNHYYEYSIAWLRVSDAMLVLPGYETSKGTLKEIEIAQIDNIPIFYSLEELKVGMKGKSPRLDKMVEAICQCVLYNRINNDRDAYLYDYCEYALGRKEDRPNLKDYGLLTVDN